MVKDWEKPIRLLFIDGGHKYEEVKMDFDSWSPFLVDGGMIIFHDSDWPGVKKLLGEEIYGKENYGSVMVIGTLTFAIKNIEK